MNKSSVLTKALQELRSIVGSNNYIDEVKDMGGYLSDWRNIFSGQSPLILKPTSTKMVSPISEIACHFFSIINEVIRANNRFQRF